MGLFGKKTPKLPSYDNLGLQRLLEQPEWAGPIRQAGLDPERCELVLRLASATVMLGPGGPGSYDAAPAILFGQGDVLAIAYPDEHEVKVVRKAASRGELQTQRSGWFQVLFGPPSALDGFMFWGGADNLQLGTPEGEAFGRVMSAFLAGALTPGQVVGTPQTLAERASAPSAPAQPAPPSAAQFSDPLDAERWRLSFAVQAALVELLEKYQACFEQATNIEKAYGLATMGHPISQENFRQHAVQMEEELPTHLAALREATTTAAAQFHALMGLFPASDETPTLVTFGQWCQSHGVPSEVLSTVAGNGMFIYTDFGLTRQSFWTENERVTSVLNS